MRRIGLALALLCGLAVSAQAAPVRPPKARSTGTSKDGVTRFLGIPYARPPVGPCAGCRRSRRRNGPRVRQATKFGPTCAQVTTLGPFAGPPNSNEDCLYLNVFTPDVRRPNCRCWSGCMAAAISTAPPMTMTRPSW